MQLRMVHLAPLVAVLLSVVTARAPGDGNAFCTDTLTGSVVQAPVHPFNVKILMDSFNYLNLLPPHDGAVWQQLNLDDNNVDGGGTEVIISTCKHCILCIESSLLPHSGLRTAILFVASQ